MMDKYSDFEAEFSPGEYENMLRIGLVFNLQELKTMIERLNVDTIDALARAGQPNEMRYIMRGIEDEIVPCTYDQFVLGPRYKSNPINGIQKLIVRMPLQTAEYFPEIRDRAWWNDIFLEIERDDGSTEHYLLNNDTLERYSSANDLIDDPDFLHTNNLYKVKDEVGTKSEVTVEYIRAVIPVYQVYRHDNRI